MLLYLCPIIYILKYNTVRKRKRAVEQGGTLVRGNESTITQNKIRLK